MELNGVVQVFLGAMLGPVMLELVKLSAWRDKEKIADKYKRPLYWLLTGVLVVVSGFVAVLNGVEHVPLLRAVLLGIDAPAIIAGYASASTSRARVSAHRAGFISLPEDQQEKTWVDLLSW